MQRGSCSYFGHRRPTARGPRDLTAAQRLGGLLDQQRFDQLIQESRYPMHQLRIGNLRRETLGGPDTAAFDECLSVGRKKFVQHFASVTPLLPSFCALPYIDTLTPGARMIGAFAEIVRLTTQFCFGLRGE
jgi:hypothetical protein